MALSYCSECNMVKNYLNCKKPNCNNEKSYGTKDFRYKSYSKKDIRKFFSSNDLSYLKSILPLKNKHNFEFPNLYIRSFEDLNKKMKKYIFFIEDYYNFSGSFKDRASLVSCLDAIEKGYNEISVASSGNAAISTAIYFNIFKLKCTVFLPSFTSSRKKEYLRTLGCKLIVLDLPYSEVVKKSLKYSKRYKTYNRCTGLNPVTREGKKIFSYQLISKFTKQIDYIFIPVGDGNIISGCCKGFYELKKMGFIKKVPKIVGVQSSSSSSFYRQFNLKQTIPSKSIAKSICDSINIDFPLDGYFAFYYLNKLKGNMVKVNDKSIKKSKELLLKKYGINSCLTSASTFSAVGEFIKKKRISKENILLLLTGSGLK